MAATESIERGECWAANVVLQVSGPLGYLIDGKAADPKEAPMPQTITKGYRALVDAAKSEIAEHTVEEAKKLYGRPDVVFVDIRDPRELERDGRIPGAFHCTRGMLEFWIDPASPYHKPIFAEDKTFVFFCAGGMRSALAAKTAQDMGLKPVAHMLGGFGGWKQAGGAVESVEQKR
jgi:rhodanese-related sulfurtransferase